MNLIDESFEPKKTDNTKKIARIILIFIVLLIIAIISIMGAIMYIQNNTTKLYIDGKQSDKVLEMMVTDTDGTIYFPIKDIASYLGYESYNGEYTDKSEDASKCYIQSENEIANFSLNSEKIYKLAIGDKQSNYEYVYAKKPVKAMNGKLYVTSDGLEKAFNVSFYYNDATKRITIYTMPYLIEQYSAAVLDYGYTGIDENFTNRKAVLNSMLIVKKGNNSDYGVIDLQGNAILEAKYNSIEYLQDTNEFLVKSNNKVGVISSKRQTKIQLLYDDLELIDSDLGLYLAKQDNKYGIIDSNGNIKIYIEYDQIGIDISRFEKNGIKNKYIIAGNLIPVKKNNQWGIFNKNGKQLIDFQYDSLGYIASNNKDAINLLVIPNYEVVVVCKDKKYGLINSEGQTISAVVCDDIYMSISGGQTHYYMNYNDTRYDIEERLDSSGVKPKNNSNSSSSNTTEDDENVTEESNNTDNTENTEFTNVSEE